MDTKTARVAALNDELRQHFTRGIAVMTPGVAALGQDAIDRIVKTVAAFNNFCPANDPYQEHDFGSFEVEGHTIFFKIDYYDKPLTYHSPDPSNPSLTECVITITLRRSTELKSADNCSRIHPIRIRRLHFGTSGRSGWLRFTPLKTLTSYPLPACLACSLLDHKRRPR